MFFYKDEVLNIFKDFDIIKFNELEKDAKTGETNTGNNFRIKQN